MENLYTILGVATNATKAEIKSAYYKLSKVFHPDTNSSPNAAEKFKEINYAYEILSNLEKRKEYDLKGTIEKEKNNTEALINYFNNRILIHVLNSCGTEKLKNHNVTNLINYAIDNDIQDENYQIQEMNKTKEKLEIILDRIKATKDSEFLLNGWRIQLEHVNFNLSQKEKDLEFLQLAKESVKEWIYNWNNTDYSQTKFMQHETKKSN